MNRLRLSLCMIVRDEARHLEACLESARPWVQESIVVDTGSTDGTPDLARRLGARVQEIAWPNDFAAARNVALGLAQGEWVLSLDADERLVAETGPQLATLVAAADAARGQGAMQCYRLRIHNHYDNVEGAPGYTISYGRRLFPKHPQLRWIRPIHEYVEHLEGQEHLSVVTSDAVIIEHHGYLTAEYGQKGNRNEQLLRSALDQNPADHLSRFYLGQQLHHDGRWGEAADTLLALIEGTADQHSTPSYLGRTFVLAANALLQLQRWREALRVAQQGMAEAAGPELACELGSAHLALSQPQEAEAAFRQAQALSAAKAQEPGDSAAATWRPWEGLAAAALQQGAFREAMAAAREAQDFAPGRAQPLQYAALASEQLGAHEEVVRYAKQMLALQPDHLVATALLGRAYRQLDQVQAAYDLLAATIQVHPAAWQLRAQLAELLLDAGEPQAAVETLTPLLDASPPGSASGYDQDRAEAYAALAQALEALGKDDDADLARQLAAAHDPVAAAADAASEEAARLVSEAERSSPHRPDRAS